MQEASQHWGSIEDENHEFDSKEQLTAALEAVTAESVVATFNEMFFQN
jgi:hypothetical protein